MRDHSGLEEDQYLAWKLDSPDSFLEKLGLKPT